MALLSAGSGDAEVAGVEEIIRPLAIDNADPATDCDAGVQSKTAGDVFLLRTPRGPCGPGGSGGSTVEGQTRRSRAGDVVDKAWEFVWSGGFFWGLVVLSATSFALTVTVLSATIVCSGRTSLVIAKMKLLVSAVYLGLFV